MCERGYTANFGRVYSRPARKVGQVPSKCGSYIREMTSEGICLRENTMPGKIFDYLRSQ